MSKGIISAGMTLSYAVEATAGTRPTSGYTKIPHIRTFPALFTEPNAIDSTTTDDITAHTYIQGLQDTGVLAFGSNAVEPVFTAWNDTLIPAYEAGQTETTPLETWFCIQHPKISKAIYFKGQPAIAGADDTDIDSLVTATLYVTATSTPEWGAKPTA